MFDVVKWWSEVGSWTDGKRHSLLGQILHVVQKLQHNSQAMLSLKPLLPSLTVT